MKEGTGGDPFADGPESDSTDSEPPTTDTDTERETASSDQPDLPYIYRRDTAKEDRDQVPFFLRDHVQTLESEFIEELEGRLETNVYKSDAREAALQVVFEKHVEEVESLLRNWGYDR